tara:strand:- start:2831 stop:3373 length:543 start_codon:yes stop_codon:yes gene_type:complete
MINLIPQAAKKSLLIEYWIRSVSVWAILWSLALIIGAAILLPPYVLISSQVSVYQESAAAASEKVENFKSVTVGLSRSNQEASMVMNMRHDTLLSDYIKLFENLEGSAIEITNITLNKNDSGIGPVSIIGVADDRQNLAAFRDRLLAEEQVEKVDLPISNLAQDRDIRFTITVDINNDDT